MTQEDLFRYGYGEYKKAIKYIESLNTILSQANIDYTVEEAKRDFDIIIQGMMLKVAIADNVASSSEIDYIKSIVDTGDILQFLKEGTRGKCDISWGLLTVLDKDTFIKLNNMLDKPLRGVMKRFSLPYVIMEIVLDKSVFDRFKDSVFGIMTPLCVIDGDFENVNEKLSVALAMKMFADSWNEVKETTRQKKKQTVQTSAVKGNTLKSRFESLKKTN